MLAQSEALTALVQSVKEKECAVLDDKYILIKKIGSGATCKVKLGQEKESGEIVAVKILNKEVGKSANMTSKHYKQEVEMLKKINHPNIINLLDGNKGAIKKPDGRSSTVDYIVLEFAANGELFDFLYFPREGLGEKYARYMFTQLIDGLDACHKAGVAHRDLKTENMMLNHEWILKIADFGYATLLAGKTGTGLLSTFLGTLSYAAPEILNKKAYLGSQADIFSTGVILFVLVTGKLPFGKAVVFDNYYKNFIRGDAASFWKIMSPKIGTVSDEFKSLITNLLSYDPAQRPSIEDIKSHPWMTGDMPTAQEVFTEFERRKKIVTEMKELEMQEEAKKKAKNGGIPGGVFRSGSSEIEEGESTAYFSSERVCIPYMENSNPYKVKLKGADSAFILNDLATYFGIEDKREKKIIPHEEHAKFTVCYETDKELVENLPDLEIENLALEVELKALDGENFIAEFSKKKGDKLEFFTVYDEFLTYKAANESEAESK